MKDRKTCSSMNLLTGALTWWSSLLGRIPTRVPCCSSIPLALPPFSVSLQLSLLNKSHSLLFTAFALTSYSPPCFLSCSSSASWLPNVGKEYAVGSVKQFKILLCVSPHLSLLLLFPVMLCYVFLRVFSASLVLSTTAFVLFLLFLIPPRSFLGFILFIPLLFTLLSPLFLISLLISIICHSSAILYLSFSGCCLPRRPALCSVCQLPSGSSFSPRPWTRRTLRWHTTIPLVCVLQSLLPSFSWKYIFRNLFRNYVQHQKLNY